MARESSESVSIYDENAIYCDSHLGASESAAVAHSILRSLRTYSASRMHTHGKQQSFIEPVAKKSSAWCAFDVLRASVYARILCAFEQKNPYSEMVWSAVNCLGRKMAMQSNCLSLYSISASTILSPSM